MYKTKIQKIDLKKNLKKQLQKAADLILEGQVVAFPTETVYGLGANALDKQAVENIFIAKNRPSDNPLIVHISDVKQLNLICKNISSKAKILIKEFWPGALTLILNKKKVVPDIVSANRNTVGVRMPSNKIALALIKLSNCPIAAPSANSFGKPSPTCAKYVYDDMNTRIPLILDGGSCDVGIESTIIDMTQKVPVLLRPGRITKEEIEKKIGVIKLHSSIINPEQKVKDALAPGMKYKHYSPNAKVYLFVGEDRIKSINSKIKKLKNKKNIGVILSSKNSLVGEKVDFVNYKTQKQFAKNIFKKFRDYDKVGKKIILVEGYDSDGFGMSIMNRLGKAATKIFN